MSHIDKVLEELFTDLHAREVIDLATLLRTMASDLARGEIELEDVRDFLSRNAVFLRAVVEMYGKVPIDVDELVERLVGAVQLEALLKPGRSIVQSYARRIRGRERGSEDKSKKEGELGFL